jgi:excisionase family DNA binding protein
MDTTIHRDAFSVEDFAKRHGIGRSTAYEEIREGRLIARKLGKRTLIVAEDARAWRESLPKSHEQRAT